MHRLLPCLALAASLAACSKSSGGDSGGGGATTGCIQGVVVNGMTGARVTLPKANVDKGLYVLIRDRLSDATSLVPDPAAAGANAQLAGEYNLCSVPLDETFPLFVWLDGFLPFEGDVTVHSTAAAQSPNAKADLVKPTPSEIANIRVYPKSQQVKDLGVLVTHDGLPLAGATVILRSLGVNFLDPMLTGFLPPKNTRSQTQSAVTDDTGKVTFPAAELVLGGHYIYTVLPPDGGSAESAAVAEAFILGLRSDADTSEPYLITVDLAHSIGKLVELSRSTDNEDPDPSGKVTVYLNREFELVPGSEDGVTASLSGAVTAVLVADVPGNKQPDTVKVTIEANKLTLEPVFKTVPDADATKELGLAVSYQGLKLRPKASPETLSTIDLNLLVRFYR